MPARRSLHVVGLQSSILPVACFMARKDLPKRRNTLKWRNKSAGKDSQFLIDRRPARSVPRHHRTARAFLYERRSSSCPHIAVRKNGVASLAYVAGIHVF
jgi:hypothetical protein